MMRHALALITLLLCCASANAQSAPKHYLSLASTNSTLVLGRSSIVKMIYAQNTGTVNAFLKFYDKVTAPTCGTDVPKLTIPLPGGASVGGPPAQPDISDGILFYAGVGFCITAAIADNDTGVATTGIVVNIGVSGK
jgi:hypothetical protein